MAAVRALGFRFVFVYLILYIYPWPIGEIPGTDWLSTKMGAPFAAFIAWVAEHVLHLAEIPKDHPTGSGDTLYAFVSVFSAALLAAVIVAVWSLLDRLRTDQRRLDDGFRVLVRFFLAAMMLSYGLAKVWKNQFPMLTEVRLAQPYGASTPMALLWNFMGASAPYTFFAGAAEALGGVLLIFRRTTLLGALVVAAVMSNVVALNFCYDVPVKQFSVHLLVMAVFLAAPDLPRLANLFLLNRPVAPVTLAPSTSRRVTRTRQAIGLLFGGFLVYKNATNAHERYYAYGDGKPPAEDYHVEAMHPPRWKQVTLAAGTFSALSTTDVVDRLSYTVDAAARTMTLGERFAPAATYVLTAARPDAERLLLVGVVRGELVTAILRRYEPAPSRLTSEEFKWIQEYPNNR
jgi:uncharacterized membrane protein YphA (DoxX/SURF4 family)